jgi:hypothetical protein
MSLKNGFLACALAAGCSVAMFASPAKADFGFHSGRGLSITIGGGHPGYRSLYYGPSYGSIYGYRAISPYQSHHSHGHYHYHPGEVIRHGSHYDLVPGHYDYYPGHGHGSRQHRGHHGHH